MEDVLIGTARVFPQSLAYLLDFDDEICIVDYKASLFSISKRSDSLHSTKVACERIR